ncbi:MAG TPA: hypothetical protein VFB84_00265 [Micromonosporaceae bacterium]|nr:hypothetical protein [Micromonosporaceae bacterium]
MGGLLADVIDCIEREAFFSRARDQLKRLRHEDPGAWETDLAESRFWQAGTDRDTLSRNDEAGWWE